VMRGNRITGDRFGTSRRSRITERVSADVQCDSTRLCSSADPFRAASSRGRGHERGAWIDCGEN
jgi:hypothetical protein